ncbi:MAG: glycosyltransferase family 9 protein, partial [Phycisphaerae bacterium]
AKLLQSVSRCHPNVTIDIACRESAREVFELMPPVGKVSPYPLELHELRSFDAHLSFEDIENITGAANMPLSQVFSRCLRIPRATHLEKVEFTTSDGKDVPIPSVDRPIVGLHAGTPGDVRTYPWALLQLVAQELIDRGFAAIFFGHHDLSDLSNLSNLSDSLGVNAPAEQQGPKPQYDFRGCTADAGELMNLFGRMDAILTNDSFPMHLAGMMEIPTVTVFTASTPLVAQDYPTVQPAVSGVECAPCHQTTGRCPMGHAACVAHDAELLRPAALASMLESQWKSATSHQRAADIA